MGTDVINFSVQVSNQSGDCPNTALSGSIAVTLTAPVATTINNGDATATICGSTPALLTATYAGAGNGNYKWFLNGAEIAGANNSTYNASATGSYTVRYKDNFGCWSFLSNAITVVPTSPITVVNISPNTTVNIALDATGNPKPGYNASVTFTATVNGAEGTFSWNLNGTPEAGQINKTYTFTPPTASGGTYTIYASAGNSCSGPINSQTVTVKVTKDLPTDPNPGKYYLTGNTCYDVYMTDYPTTSNCMPLSARTNDFDSPADYVRTYNFNTVFAFAFSNLNYIIEDPNHLISSYSASGTNNEILTINYDSDPLTGVRAKATGKDRNTALAVKIIAQYTDNGGTDYQVSFTIKIQDCSCGCIVKKSATEWMTFMCYNLGADPTKNIFAQMAYTPTNDYDMTVYGGFYQWGRKIYGAAPGYTARNSATTGTTSSIDIPAHNYHIIRPVSQLYAPWDWRVPQNHNLWGATKTIYDPCPDGWRVPTYAEWNAVITYNTTVRPTGLIPATGTDGLHIRPDGVNTTLFLPATGSRAFDGTYYMIGTTTAFWSSTPTGEQSWFVEINSGTIVFRTGTRSFGYPIRCIAE
jgi:uncharacterized protein (TIGR02145 family)